MASIRILPAVVSIVAAACLAVQTVGDPPACGFADAVAYDVAGGPRSVAVGDLDGDLDLDLAVDGVSILLNHGDGTFTYQPTYGAGGICVAVGDLDGDLDLDLAVLGWRVYILLNNGDGTFDDGGSYDYSEDDAVSMTVGDLDSDGDLDLVVAAEEQHMSSWPRVLILWNNGDATFECCDRYVTAGYGPAGIAVGDLDGDNDLDIAMACSGEYDYLCECRYGDHVSILLNNGDGTFADDVSYAASESPASVAVGDFDGDLDLDLAVGGGCDEGLAILLNAGNGTFTAATTYASDGSPRSVAVGDLDGDLDLDLVVAHYYCSSNYVSAVLNNGDGTFGAHVIYDVGVSPGYSSIVLGDLDGDLDLDLAAASRGIDAVSILLNDCAPPPCHADLDDSGDVGFTDLDAVLNAWGPCLPDFPPDIDGSGDVGFEDLLMVLSTWGPCP
jgi:hypothetical protein